MKKCWISLTLLTFVSSGAWAQMFEVEQIEKGLFIRSAPTMTALRPASNARAVLIFIPGGEGVLNFTKSMDPTGSPRSPIGRALAKLSTSSVAAHVVAVDSPYVLPATAELSSRETGDHLVRIESVVEFYRARFNLPIWLMGHSNGGYSVAEFLKHLRDKKKEDLIAGVVFSAGRDISRFGPIDNLPMLFTIAERDGCHSTTVAGNRAIYEKVKATNKAPMDFVLVNSGEHDNRNPCFGGIHVFNGAEDELAKVLEQFISRNLPPKSSQ